MFPPRTAFTRPALPSSRHTAAEHMTPPAPDQPARVARLDEMWAVTVLIETDSENYAKSRPFQARSPA